MKPLKTKSLLARCNAINIIPDNGEADVQDNEDDVVVSEPPTPKKKQIPFLKNFCCNPVPCLLGCSLFVLFGDDEKKRQKIS